MNQAKSFNIDTNLFNNYSTLFIKLVLLLVIAYLAVMLFNLIRDKFISPSPEFKKDEITGLFTILHRLFWLSGWGFIIGNIVQCILNVISKQAAYPGAHPEMGSWDYLLFGIILIFAGKGLKAGLEQLKKDNN